jgi:hypothetical protein
MLPILIQLLPDDVKISSASQCLLDVHEGQILQFHLPDLDLYVINRGGHLSRFNCKLIEVVTKAGLTVT